MSEDAGRPPSKRARKSDPDPVPIVSASTRAAQSRKKSGDLKGVIRDGKIWFKDGSIVLVAEQAAFRVYREQLKARSAKFAEIFDAHGPGQDEVYDGCPAVRLTDSPHDLGILLAVIFTSEYTYFYDHDPVVPFDVTFAVVKLSHKYGLEDLKDQGLGLLQNHYSSHIDAWNQATPFADVTFTHAIGAVVLARLTTTPWLLPMALYTCYELGEAVQEGWKRPNKTTEHLNEADMERLRLATTTLDQRGVAEQLRFFSHAGSNPDCSSPSRCKEMVFLSMANFASEGTHKNWHPLSTDFEQIISRATDALCESCRRRAQEFASQQRHALWKDLPKIFNVIIKGWGTQDALGRIPA